jgi:uncharacterized protein YhaN
VTRSPVCGPLAAALLGLLAVLASAVPRANAQGDADAGVDVPAVVPFAASEIASATNDTSAALAALELSLAPSREMKAIEAALPGLEERVSEQAESPAGRLGLRELDEARQTWLATQSDLEHYQSALEERAARLEEVARELEDMRARWQATRDVDPTLPDAALEQARRALRDVARTRRKVEESLAKTLQVQRNVARVQLVVTGVLNRIEGAESDLRGQLTQRTRGFIYPHMPARRGRARLRRAAWCTGSPSRASFDRAASACRSTWCSSCCSSRRVATPRATPRAAPPRACGAPSSPRCS